MGMRSLFGPSLGLISIGGKMGVATTRAPNSLGPPKPTKNLGQLLSRNHGFKIFKPERAILAHDLANYQYFSMKLSQSLFDNQVISLRILCNFQLNYCHVK